MIISKIQEKVNITPHQLLLDYLRFKLTEDVGTYNQGPTCPSYKSTLNSISVHQHGKTTIQNHHRGLLKWFCKGEELKYPVLQFRGKVARQQQVIEGVMQIFFGVKTIEIANVTFKDRFALKYSRIWQLFIVLGQGRGQGQCLIKFSYVDIHQRYRLALQS